MFSSPTTSNSTRGNVQSSTVSCGFVRLPDDYELREPTTQPTPAGRYTDMDASHRLV
jgi:hypothetical protein